MNTKIENKILHINEFIKTLNSFEAKNLNEFLTTNFIYKNISHGEIIESTEGLIEFYLILEQSKTLFKSRNIEIENINIQNNIAEAKVSFHIIMAMGTIDGLRAGQELNFQGSFNFTFDNNKLAKVIQIV